MRISDGGSDVCSSDLEAPLQTGREARAAAAAQARRFYFLDVRVLAACHQILGLVPIAARLRGFQGPGLKPIEVGKDAILVVEAHAPHSNVVFASAAKQSPARNSSAALAPMAGDRRVATLLAMTENSAEIGRAHV